MFVARNIKTHKTLWYSTKNNRHTISYGGHHCGSNLDCRGQDTAEMKRKLTLKVFITSSDVVFFKIKALYV